MNTEQKILISLIGNRDLQISNKNLKELPKKFADLFELNTSNNEYAVIKKGNKKFWEHSKQLFNEAKDYFHLFSCPMIEKSIKEVNNVDTLILTPTHQNPNFHQDTYWEAKIIKASIETKYKLINVEIDSITFNPNDFKQTSDYFLNIFKSKSEYSISFHNSGGTPNMRSASQFAALFKGIQFYTFSESSEKNESSYNEQESKVLKEISIKMLKSYNYEGVKQLFPRNKKIIKLCEIGLSCLALDFENADKIAKQIGKQHKDIINQFKNRDHKFYEKQLLFSALIKRKQGSIGDFLWRLFTIQDNILLPVIESLLNGQVVFNKRDPSHPEWNELLKTKPDLITHLSKQTVNESPLKYSPPNKYVYLEIINYYSEDDEYNKLLKLNNILTDLSGLRNRIAHNYSGINQKMLENQISNDYFGKKNKVDSLIKLFFDVLYVEEGTEYDFFNNINQKILSII